MTPLAAVSWARSLTIVGINSILFLIIIAANLFVRFGPITLDQSFYCCRLSR